VSDAAGNIYFPDSHRIRRVSPDGVITTIAGNGVDGTSGDGGPALSANLGIIHQMAVYGSDLCFGDTAAYRIRCVDLESGLIHGWGTGNAGTGGDGGDVSGASFTALFGAAFDEAGNLYVSDSSAGSVRRVDASTGTITMFAGPGPGYCCAPTGDGRPATGASLFQPTSLYYRNGYIYIADAGNYRVRRVDLSTGVISTMAGNGTATDSGGSADGTPALLAGLVPSRIVVEPSGSLFVSTGTAIRKVGTDGMITTVAGTHGAGNGYEDGSSTETSFADVRGLGWDPVAKRLLISDGGIRIRQIFYTAPTTTVLTSSTDSALSGGRITLQAEVTPHTATGSVRFYLGETGWTLLGSAPLHDGVADFLWTVPPGGHASYPLRAVYSGDASHNLSSAAIAEAVQQGMTTTAVLSSTNTTTQGENVTFTASVTPREATGAIQLVNGSTALRASNLSNGVATFHVADLPPGSNSIAARYTGDAAYSPSVSAPLTQYVQQTGAKVSAPPSAAHPAHANEAVHAQQARANPDGSNGPGTPHGGGFSGSRNNPAHCTVRLRSSANPLMVGKSITLKAQIRPTPAKGIVRFLDDSALLGTVTAHGDSAVLTLPGLAAGDHFLVAVFSGDTAFAICASQVLTQAISKTPTKVTLRSSPNPAVEGQALTLAAVVSPPTATGLVGFSGFGSALLGAAPVKNGAASLTLPAQSYPIPAGMYSITAVYSGAANYAASRSSFLKVTILGKRAKTVRRTCRPQSTIARQTVPYRGPGVTE
jgi:hypothetical protein